MPVLGIAVVEPFLNSVAANIGSVRSWLVPGRLAPSVSGKARAGPDTRAWGV